jgi:hypothetical protein
MPAQIICPAAERLSFYLADSLSRIKFQVFSAMFDNGNSLAFI